jgi:iron complex transport system permease protein
MVFAVVFLLLGLYQRDAGALNALTIGEPEARHMGIDVEKLKIRLIILTALGVGVAVAICGIIGFVGLVVPHLVRMLVGPDHRSLIPLSALAGALLLLIADVGSRLLLAPEELPVGIMTSVFGAPFFTFLLIQQRKQLM